MDEEQGGVVMGNKKPEPDTAKPSAQQLLRDPGIQLTDAVFAEALGPANSAYRAFLGELPNHDIQLEWRYYTDGKAWLGKGIYRWKGARGGQKEMTVFWMSIWEGFFKVSIFFPEASRTELLALLDPLCRLPRKCRGARRTGQGLRATQCAAGPLLDRLRVRRYRHAPLSRG